MREKRIENTWMGKPSRRNVHRVCEGISSEHDKSIRQYASVVSTSVTYRQYSMLAVAAIKFPLFFSKCARLQNMSRAVGVWAMHRSMVAKAVMCWKRG